MEDDDDHFDDDPLAVIIKDRLEFVSENPCGRRTVIATKGCPPPLYNSDALAASGNQPSVLIFEHFIKADSSIIHSESLIARLWNEYICHPYIPYCEEERRSKLARAYQQLGSQIDYHRQRPAKLTRFAGEEKEDVVHEPPDADSDEL